MSSTDITEGKDIGVNVGAIEKELANLWRSASKDKQVTRACSWNLVVNTVDDAVFDEVKPIVDEAVRHVPSRTVILKPRAFASGPHNKSEIEAWVSANCQVAPGGGKLLCTEEITIEARGKEGQEHIPGLIRALNVPDVPTALWWAGPPPTEPSAVRILLAGVDRLLFDTALFAEVDAFGGGLSRLAHVGGLLDDLVLCDLAWLRTGSLRSLLASLFDAAGVEPLARIAKVKVSCTPRGVPCAKLLLGWLASRLAWGAAERLERGLLQWRVPARGGGHVRLEIETHKIESTRQSGIAAVALETAQGERFALTDVGEEQMRIDAPAATLPSCQAHEPSLSQLLVAALGSRGRDRLFPVALHRAVELDRDDRGVVSRR